MSVYFLIDLAIFSFPFLYSFEKRVSFYKKFPAVFLAIFCAGIPYILWDMIATKRGDWSFNPLFISGIKFFGLPFEEILFFIVAPFSCLFIYECICYFIKEDKIFDIPKRFWLFVAFLCLFIALINKTRDYSMMVMISCGFFILMAFFLKPSFFQSKRYWLFIVICIIPFLIFNGILTWLPVVSYNPKAIWGVRIFTIPLEDLFYNYSLLSFNLFFYLFFLKKINPR